MAKFQVYVHEIVGLWCEVEADSKAEAREMAAHPDQWLNWQEVPDVEHVWVPRNEKAEPIGGDDGT